MRAVALFSGGKDSTAALHKAFFNGVELVGACVAKPREDSAVFHYPYTEIAVKVATSMGLNCLYEEVGDDLESIKKFLKSCSDEFGADYLIAGVLRSDFQRIRLEYAARSLGKSLLLPFWGADPPLYLKEIYKMGIRFVVVRAMASGFPRDLVGKVVGWEDIDRLLIASSKYKFDPAFEGGEAETLVIDAPLMKKSLRLEGRKADLPGEVSHYFITRAELVEKPGRRSEGKNPRDG